MDKQNSFSAADSLPAKLIQNNQLVQTIVDRGVIPPIHIQLLPTNKCNLNCSWCSCKEDDCTSELPIDVIKQIIDKFAKLGTKSCTISGGGEALVHKNFEDIVNYLYAKNIMVGMVTNGTLLHTVSYDTLSKLVWCRISHGDGRIFGTNYQQNLSKVVSNVKIDWAFSYVATDKYEVDNICQIIEFANLHSFTHVRLVADIFNASLVDMSEVKNVVRDRKINDSIVIYQNRDEPTRGSDCYICYLKPVISADGKIYTCCGSQYALGDDYKMSDRLCLGTWEQIEEIWSNKQPFNGSICKRCYYSNYNNILGVLKKDLIHREFV